MYHAYPGVMRFDHAKLSVTLGIALPSLRWVVFRFEAIKKDYGFEEDDSVVSVLVYEKYKQLFPKKA